MQRFIRSPDSGVGWARPAVLPVLSAGVSAAALPLEAAGPEHSGSFAHVCVWMDSCLQHSNGASSLVTWGIRWTKAEVTWFLKTQDILSTTLCWTKQITEPARTPGVAQAHSCFSDSLHCYSNKGRLRCTKIKWWILGELSHH